MSTLLLLVYPVALILGGMLLGWLARWYRYGGRCGPRGLVADGVPNIDAERGTVTLDGTEPVKTAGPRRAKAAEDARAALGALRSGYAGGKRADAPDAALLDASPAARIGALAGNATAAASSVGAGIAEASASASTSMRETGSDAAQSVKDTASGVADGTKSGLAAMKEGYAEGKAPGGTPDAPADGSVAAKVGAALGGAVASVKGAASSAADSAKSAVEPLRDGTAKDRVASTTGDAAQSVKDTASGVADSTKSGLAAMKEGYAEGKAPGGTPDAPADGSVAAKVGAALGGAVASVTGAVSGAVETARAAVTSDDDAAATGTPEEAARHAARHDRGLPGATIGQEDGHVPFHDAPASAKPGAGLAGRGGGTEGEDDSAALRARFAALADEASEDDTATETGDLPETLDPVEEEARRLIDSGEAVGKPDSALAARPRERAPDDLKRISGIGPKIEGTLNDEGIYYFEQIAGFTGRDLAWADRTLGFHGRVVRDRWIPQARRLALAGPEEGGVTRPAAYRGEPGTSGDAPVNTPLGTIESEALDLIEREGGYAATAQNRPDMLMRDGPVGGTPDDLKRIKGIGEKLEKVLNGLGVYYFRQIAAFSARDIAWVDSKLKFKGRIIRDRWVPQAAMFERNRDI